MVEKSEMDGTSMKEIDTPVHNKKNIEVGCIRTESSREFKLSKHAKALNRQEKKYLLAVERGDLATVKRFIQRAKRSNDGQMDVNCWDPLGRSALIVAIDNENLEMVELLVIMGVATKDALLHAINKEFVEAVELLLEHEEIFHKEGTQYSWEAVDRSTSSFTADMTPLILAAHRNNYEILKILLDRGATIPLPHDIRCGCDTCVEAVKNDSLRHSISRINTYRALSSPSLIALSSTDPILTAFELSVELKALAYSEPEFRQDYMDLRKQCQTFAVDLLSHTRTSEELALLLNYDPTAPISHPDDDGEHMKLARLKLAVDYKQKKFVAQQNIQQLLGLMWYEGLPGFRRRSPVGKCAEMAKIALLFPFLCCLYIVAPNTHFGQLIRKPFVKFLIHASSYLFFLLLLILVSQRVDVLVVQVFGSESIRTSLADQLKRQRGNGPTYLECAVAFYVLGYIWDELREMYDQGTTKYMKDMWNIIDCLRDGFYLLVLILRTVAYIQQSEEIAKDPSRAYVPREEWDAFDPQLIAEGFFAMANIFSALKLVHLFSINPHLGPLQISLGRMVIDIVKFFFIYSLVLFSFACGLNQLLWYYSDLEKEKCYSTPDGLPDWKSQEDACIKWRRFNNLFESSQSLFWASFGLMDLSVFEMSGIKSYTRFWGMMMFGTFSIINVVVLLNLLIAMMSNSYTLITEHSDMEWKFARARLWMSYFELGSTLPSPFNLIVTPKQLIRFFDRSSKKILSRLSTKRRKNKIRERDLGYAMVMRSLVWRYVTTMQRLQYQSGVTEDDINEVKGDISTLRFELLEVFKTNGMDTSTADTNTRASGRKVKIWERRLMRDFHVVSVAGEEEAPTDNSDDRFRKLALLVSKVNADQNGSGSTPVTKDIKMMSQIGRSMSNESFQSSMNLQRAIEEANRLTVTQPTPQPSPDTNDNRATYSGSNVLQLLNTMKEEEEEEIQAGSHWSDDDITGSEITPKFNQPSVVKYRSETNKADTVTETEEAPASTATVTFELKRKPDDGDKSSRIGNNWM